jgi:hypothetical protein
MLILTHLLAVVLGGLLVVFFSKNNKNTIAKGSQILHDGVDKITKK